MDRDNLLIALPAAAVGMMLSMLMFTAMVPSPMAAAPVSAFRSPKKVLELDCSGSPHVTIRADTIIFTGWKDDRKVSVYNGSHRDDIDISGLLCSVSIREDI